TRSAPSHPCTTREPPLRGCGRTPVPRRGHDHRRRSLPATSGRDHHRRRNPVQVGCPAARARLRSTPAELATRREPRMQCGVSTFITDEGIRPTDLGKGLEERGFDALFIAEHTHIPASRETPYPGGGDLPREYYRTLDPFVALSAIAA